MRRKSLQNNQTYLSRIGRRKISKTIQTSSSYLSSSLEQYNQQMTKQPLVKFKTKKASPIYRAEQNKNGNFKLNNQLRKAKQQLAQIRKQIKVQHSHTEVVVGEKIGKLISIFKENLNQKYTREYSPPNNQQIYYPVPMPMPYPYMVQNHATSNKQSPHSFRAKDTIDFIKGKFKDKEYKAARKRKNMKKWRKVGNSILFIIYLKRFCRLFQKGRKIMFSKFIAKYTNISKIISKALSENLQSFFKLLQVNDVQVQIQAGQSRQIVKEKRQLVKNMIRMILQAIMKTIESNQAEIAQFTYLLCRHGSYACTYPLLTEEQLELCCISSNFSYISAEKHLQKAAIINLIFIKMVIANIFLSPINLSSNIYYLSSVLYEFVINIQDEYLMMVPKSYKIGNYQSFAFVKRMDSIIVNDAPHKAGEIISGLKGEQQIKKWIGFDVWNNEKKILIQTVNRLWVQMKTLHVKLMQNYY